jgi:FMN phosphatase YigB (HAD superfamily)
MNDIKVLAFDAGGTVLDWHAGLSRATSWVASSSVKPFNASRLPWNSTAVILVL